MSAAEQLFRFCELDFPFPLGPADGRYLRRAPDGEELAVVVIRALHAPRRRRMRRRPTPAAPDSDSPEAVPITRTTVIPASALSDSHAAEWLRSCARHETATAEVDEALAHLNHVLAAHRVAAHDPYRRDVVPADVQRVRLGYGTGEEIVDGRWRDAYVVPTERARRRPPRRLRSTAEAMAGMLTGRRPAPRPSEELLLHARRDFDHGRLVEAALVTRAATDALAAEGVDAEGERADAVRIAAQALAGELSPEQAAALDELLRDLERAARRRRYAAEG